MRDEACAAAVAAAAAAVAAAAAAAVLVSICTSAVSSSVHTLPWLLQDNVYSGCVQVQLGELAALLAPGVTVWLWAQ